MKKIYSYLCAAAAVLSAASCQKGITHDLKPADGYRFSASIVETKTVLKDNVKTYWEEGDNITVFDADNNPVTFFGQHTGTVATADFLAETYNPGTKAYAVYPANDDVTFDGSVFSGLSIAAEQTAVAGGFDPRYAIAVGEETSEGNLTFSNVHSLIKFTIRGESPSKVTFTNGNTKAIAGNVSYDLSTQKATVDASESSKEIVLKPASGSFDVGETYYIVFCADGNLSNMTLKFDDIVVKEVSGIKANVKNGKIFNLGEVSLPEEEEILSNLEEDVEINTENGYFYIESFDDYYEIGKYNYLISLYNTEDFETGDFLQFEILSDDPEGIIGEFQALTDDATELQNYFIPGNNKNEVYADGMWSTYSTFDYEIFAPIVSGSLKVTADGDVYTFTFDCADDAGNKITGTIKATELVLE